MPRARWLLPALVLPATGCAADAVERAWQDRPDLPDCGSVDLDQGQSLRRDAPEAIACLREGLRSGEGAELEVTYPTVEGDPITTYYRVTPEGTAEAYEDGTQDEYGDGRWHFTSCHEPTTALDVNC